MKNVHYLLSIRIFPYASRFVNGRCLFLLSSLTIRQVFLHVGCAWSVESSIFKRESCSQQVLYIPLWLSTRLNVCKDFPMLEELVYRRCKLTHTFFTTWGEFS